jgi:hypothetical protein
LLFNKNSVAELVLTMEQIFNHLVFILGGNEDHNGRMVGARDSKVARARCNAEIRGRP